MAKRIEIDERLKQQIEAKCGEGVDLSKFVAYQARVVSTEPLSQNSMYDKAQVSASTISELEILMNDPLRNTTIQVMHDDGELPTGRIIVAKAVDEMDTGARALYATFIVSTEHPEIISKLDAGIIDEVSIGFSGKKLICSECQKDFLEADDGLRWLASLTGTCPHCDAKFGKDGAHLNIIGVKNLYEVSLVNRGAARHAKILDKTKQLSLAANSKQVKASLSELEQQAINLHINGKLTDEEEKNMDEILAKLAELSENLQKFEEKVEGRFEELAKKEEPAPAAEEPEAEAAPAEEPAPAAEPAAEEEPKGSEEEANPAPDANEAVAAELADMKKFMLDEVNKVLVASGKEKLPEDANFQSMKDALESGKLTLAASIPVGGVANAADSNAKDNDGCKYTANQLAALRLKN